MTDHYFYNNEKNEHYLIELKAGGDLDNKKAKTEKLAMLQEYFILKNSLRDKPNDKIKLFWGRLIISMVKTLNGSRKG